MTTKARSATLVGCGCLLMTLGAMPLTGYFGYLLWPAYFQKDAFIGSVFHLLIGLIPWLAGTIMLGIGPVKVWQLLVGMLLGAGGGALHSFVAFFNPKEYKGFVGWLAIYALGIILAAMIRVTLEICKKTKTAD